MKKRLLSIILALAMVVLLLPQNSLPVFAATVTVTDFTTLQNAITNASDGDTIEITAPIMVTAQLSVTKSLTFTASGDGKLTRNSSFSSGSMFYIDASGKTVTFKNITIDGENVNASKGGIEVNVGALVFENGAVVQNCKASGQGAGVYVNPYATFTMNGGSITNNITTSSYSGGDGAGVLNRGVFTMNNGSIANNTSLRGGGGVCSAKIFNMTGGIIENNQAVWIGGGIFIADGSSFTMTGGIIRNNIIANTGNGGGLETGVNCPVKLSGNVEIYGNKKQDGSADNIYMERGQTLELIGELTNMTPIGVSMDQNYKGVFTKGTAVENDTYIDHFTSDISTYSVLAESIQLKWVPNTSPVTITVKKDDVAWSGHGKTFKLVKSGTDYTNLTSVPNGTYDVYEGVADTGVDVTVDGAAASATVDYYTVTLTAGEGIASTSGAGTYLKGSSPIIDAVAASGYSWSKWKQTTGGAELSTTNSYTITNIQSAQSYTASADSDATILEVAKSAAQGANYANMTQAEATSETVIMDTLKATAVTAVTAVSGGAITVTINKISYTEPVAGTSATPSGTDGNYKFTVTVKKGEQPQTTEEKTITIKATAFTGTTDADAVAAAKAALVNGTADVAFGADQVARTDAVQAYVNGILSGTVDAAGVSAVVTYNSGTEKYDIALNKGSENDNTSISMTLNVSADPDISIINSARLAAQAASYNNMTQAEATSETVIMDTLKATAVTAVTAVSGGVITVTINKISYTEPITGTSATPSGTDGTYTFAVTVDKGAQSQTTVQKSIIITATAFTGTTDAQAVADAKTAIVNGEINVAYGTDQTAKTATVQNYVNNIINNTAGVTATVTHSSGNTYNVTITKGAVSDTKTITMTVNEAVNPDVALVNNAKVAIEGASYTMTQANGNELDAIKAGLASQMNALAGMNGTGITVAASDITFSEFNAATAGTYTTPVGTNGSFTFTVALAKGAVMVTTAAKIGTITATAYINNNEDSYKPAGTIEKNQQREEGAPTATINNSTDSLKTSVFTTEEKQKVAAGEDAKVILKIEDISNSVSVADKKLVENKLIAEQQSSGQPSSEKPSATPAVLYIDISLYKQIGREQETKVTETSSKISISIEVPQSLWNTDSNNNRTYRVVRVHDNIVEILEGTYDPVTHMFTFETDRFSTYGLTYQDAKTMSDDTSTDGKTENTTDITKVGLTAYHDFNHMRLTAKAAKTSQKLTYLKISGADGYLIYGEKCGQDWKQLADVDGTVTSYTVKNLRQATYYKFKVKAYKIIDGKQVIIATSKLVRSVTTSKTYGNPTKITIKTTSVTLAVGKTKKVDYQVVLPENHKMKDYASLTRFETTDKKIATISNSGKITAKAKGTCYIYVYAQNGVYKKIKVIVK